jgi:hypothetical protein
VALTRSREVVRQLGDDNQEAAAEELNGGSARAWRGEEKNGERCSKDRAGHHPLIGRRREAGVEASWPVSMPWFEGAGYRSQ